MNPLPLTAQEVEDALLPCPFCGGKARHKWQGTFNNVVCGVCDAEGQSFIDSDDAAKAWNTRQPTARAIILQRLVGELVAGIEGSKAAWDRAVKDNSFEAYEACTQADFKLAAALASARKLSAGEVSHG